ncbi:hypothetical protein HU200_061037 [Digitaria exilis]|uniref:Uncharacterized protein n=1 Tax=Digitaria exilis TaxID=1010633 RepID=A0A835A5G1_9POAL|nr:hypothetical protein HU200_061037 [Digitaria exilis]
MFLCIRSLPERLYMGLDVESMLSGLRCSYPVTGRKRLKLSGDESSDSEPFVCSVSACDDSGGSLFDRCPEQHQVASGTGDLPQNTGVFPAMQENLCSSTNNGVVYPKSALGYSAGRNETHGAYLQHQYLEGCMYMNEHGQMCGPYPPEQLFEGLSTGFLPQNLAIYAVFGGKTVDPVPLSFLKQFLSQWNFVATVSTPNASMETKKVISPAKMVLPDIYHVDDKFGPFTLVSLIGSWSGEDTERSEAAANDSASLNGLVGDIVGDVSHQLHAGIMKSARRVLIDEIFSCVLPDLMASKKAEKQLAAKLKNETTKPECVSNKKVSEHTVRVNKPSNVAEKGNSLYNIASVDSSESIQSTEVHDRFADILSAAWQKIYYESMKNVWDGILAEPVMDYCDVWLQRNCQMNLPSTISSATLDNIDTQDDHETSLKDSDATECDMKFPPGFEPCWESESSVALFSGPFAVVQRMLANELYVSSKQSLFQHFEEVIAEEIANCLCYGLQSSIDQEQIGTPIHAPESPPISAEVSRHEEPSTAEMATAADEELNTAETLSSHGEENLPLVSYARIFEKMDICMTAELDESFDEVPPGMETGIISLPPIDKNIYQPVRSMNSVPVISRYITLALHRQRLHENVLVEWASLFSDTISECLDSWYTRQNTVPKIADGSSKLKEYTYYRKRKSKKICQAISSKEPVEISMDEQLSKPISQLVDPKIYLKNDQESSKASKPKRVSFVDKPPKKRSKTVAMANDAHNLNIQQDLKLVSSEVPKKNRSHPTKKQVSANKTPTVTDSVMNTSMLTKPVKKRKGRNISSESSQKAKPMISCPESDGCAKASISGWEWRNWARNATPSERARVRGYRVRSILAASNKNMWKNSQVKVSSARTERVKLRRLLRAYKGAELLKITQMKARKKKLRFQRSKIHEWGLVALELIESEDFVIEYVGELIRKRVSDIRESKYEKSGIGSSYLFRLDDDYVVGHTDHSSLASSECRALASSFFILLCLQ